VADPTPPKPPYDIKVTFGADIPGISPPISEPTTISVNAIVQLQVVLQPGDNKTVQLMPDTTQQPDFLLIRVMKIGATDVKKGTDLQDAGLKLTYATLPAPALPPTPPQPPATQGQNPPQQSHAQTQTQTQSQSAPAATPPPPPAPPTEKPIGGTHMFASGMAEWVSAQAPGGQHGPINGLHFWNRTPKDATKDLSVTILVVAGYCPVTQAGTNPTQPAAVTQPAAAKTTTTR
jgi:hypothetical protein